MHTTQHLAPNCDTTPRKQSCHALYKSSTGLIAFVQIPLLSLKTSQSGLPFLSQFRPPVRRYRILEEPRPPFFAVLLPLCGFLALPLFELLLYLGGLCVLLAENGGRYSVPEAARFIG